MYTDIIIKNNNLEKTCKCCGQKTVYYKRYLRSSSIELLKEMKFLPPMNGKQLKLHLENQGIKASKIMSMIKCYSDMEHLQLIKNVAPIVDGKQVGLNEWIVSQKGMDFLEGRRKCEEYFYGNRIESFDCYDIGMPPAPEKFIKEFTFKDQSDKLKHYEESIAMNRI
jgi:hypothetical protein